MTAQDSQGGVTVDMSFSMEVALSSSDFEWHPKANLARLIQQCRSDPLPVLAVEVVLDEGGEADSWQIEQPPRKLGVEQRLGIEADLGKTHQVLRRSMQDPLIAVECCVEWYEVVKADRVNEMRARTLTTDLHEMAGVIALGTVDENWTGPV